MGFQASPLILKSYFVPELAYTANPDVEPTNEYPITAAVDDLNLSIAFSPLAEREYRFELKVELKNTKKSFPYAVTVMVVGAFEVVAEFPSERREEMVHVNAPSLLYSIAREIVTSTTVRSPYPPLLLPSIRFTPEQRTASDQPLVASKPAGSKPEQARASGARQTKRPKKAKEEAN